MSDRTMIPTTRQIAAAVLVFACGLILGTAARAPDPPTNHHQAMTSPPAELKEKYKRLVQAWQSSEAEYLRMIGERDTEIRFLLSRIDQLQARGR